MLAVKLNFDNKLNPRKHSRATVIFFIFFLSTFYSISSFADTSRGRLTISLAIMSAKNLASSERSFVNSRYTWGAAEVSLLKAGYLKPARIANVNEIYWFTVPVSGKPMVIGVSVNSGEIKHTYQVAN